ncbi:MAG TPA: prepilin-type N-terminal cleavage/methylation domain-containing protein [Vicinamibacteria bacterium]
MTYCESNRARGFSLIEILVVVSIVVIIAAISIPIGLSFVKNYQITGAAQNVAAQIQSARSQAVKRNTQRGILLNFNYPQDIAGRTQYQYTSLDPSPVTGTWDGAFYPIFAPLTYTEGLLNYGAVPAPPNNINDPDRPNGVLSPHGIPIALPDGLAFDPGQFNALLFRADGSVRGVNAANNVGQAAVIPAGVDFQIVVRDPINQLNRTITISRNGRVTVQTSNNP